MQQERKHELNSSVVDGFGVETRMNCQQDGFCFYPGICCCSLLSGCPVKSPRIYTHSSQVRPHCAVQSQGLGWRLCKRICQVCQEREHTPQRGIWEPPHFPQLGEGPKQRDPDLSQHPPPPEWVSPPPTPNVFKSPRQQEPRRAALSASPPRKKKRPCSEIHLREV